MVAVLAGLLACLLLDYLLPSMEFVKVSTLVAEAPYLILFF